MEAMYYPAPGCIACQEMFRDFFIFCVQNDINYQFRRDVKGLEEPVIEYGGQWFKGDNFIEDFKKAWLTGRGQDVIRQESHNN